MKVTKFKIKAGTYPFSVKVFISKDIDKSVDFVNKKQRRKGRNKYKKENFKNNYAVFCSHDKYEPVIWMPKKPKTAREICSVAHEVLHAVFENMEWFGISLDKSSEEAFTYLHTHLMQQFLNKCGFK